MKKYFILSLFFVASTQAHLWIHNKTNYYIKFVAETSVGEESINVSAGYADFLGDFKYTFAYYKRFKIYLIHGGGERLIVNKVVNEGGNRKIVIKDTGTPDSIYIAEDILEGRIPSSWGHKTRAEDVGTRWL